jgi:hypothetical protein
MAKKLSFILFDKVRFLEPGENIEYNWAGDLIDSESSYLLDYIIFPSFDENNSDREVGKKDTIKIDADLDPEILSSKDPIKYCRQHNDTQLKIIHEHYLKLRKEDASYKTESNVTSPEIKYYEKIVAIFRRWYRRKKIDLPDFDNIDEFLKLRGINASFLDEQNKLLKSDQSLVAKKPVSKLDKKNEVINKSVVFINTEIEKLGTEYNKRAIIDICADAYEQFVTYENKKRIIQVTKYSEAIFPKLKHRFNKWTITQFKKYLSSQVSPDHPTGKSNIIGIFFLYLF